MRQPCTLSEPAVSRGSPPCFQRITALFPEDRRPVSRRGLFRPGVQRIPSASPNPPDMVGFAGYNSFKSPRTPPSVSCLEASDDLTTMASTQAAAPDKTASKDGRAPEECPVDSAGEKRTWPCQIA